MKTALRRTLACGIASCILCAFAADSNAGWFDKGNQGIANPRIAAGLFTGTLSGDIKIDNKSFHVTPKTMVYVVGEGPTDDYGLRLRKRPVTVRGTMVNGVMVAHTIIIGGTESYFASRDTSERIISGNNPNVGVVEDGSE